MDVGPPVFRTLLVVPMMRCEITSPRQVWARRRKRSVAQRKEALGRPRDLPLESPIAANAEGRPSRGELSPTGESMLIGAQVKLLIGRKKAVLL